MILMTTRKISYNKSRPGWYYPHHLGAVALFLRKGIPDFHLPVLIYHDLRQNRLDNPPIQRGKLPLFDERTEFGRNSLPLCIIGKPVQLSLQPGNLPLILLLIGEKVLPAENAIAIVLVALFFSPFPLGNAVTQAFPFLGSHPAAGSAPV